MKNQCKKIEELLHKLEPHVIIYTTNKGNNYHFIEYRNNRLYFDIPNHKHPVSPYKKAITEQQFCGLLNKLQTNKILISEDFPFQDCRKAAFYGFVNILCPNKAIKARGQIMI